MSILVHILISKLSRCISEESSAPLACSCLIKLKDDFERLEPYLEHIDEKRAKKVANEAVLKSVIDICEMTYKVENIIDTHYRLKNSFSSHNKCWLLRYLFELFGASWLPFVPGFLKRLFGDGFEEQLLSCINEVDQYVRNVRLAYNGTLKHVTRYDVHSMRFRPLPRVTSLIGRENELKVLQDMIMKKRVKNVERIGVVGIQGIGKTTVARAVYEAVKGQFDCHAWVVLSDQNLTLITLLKELLKGILYSLSVITTSNIDDITVVSPLKGMIRNYLRRRNFLLVLDDITLQNEAVMKSLKDVLPSDCTGKLVLISRDNFLKDYCDRDILKIDELNPRSALKLFKKSSGEKISWSSIGNIADEIVMQSELYSPLSIITVGGLLSTKKKTSEWREVRKRLPQADFLPFCYASMPPVLKTCFLYTSIFPHHREISCKRLQRIWIAEGFINVKSGVTHEDAAEFIMCDLIQRNLLHAVRVGIDGKAKTCSLLRPIRDFAIQRCKEDRFNSAIGSMLKADPTASARYLSVYGEINMNKLDLTQIRSFFSSGCKYQPFLNSFSWKFNMLGVLELQYIPVNSLSESIQNLFLLKYLGLRGTKLKALPKWIGNLGELQTIDVRETLVMEVPPEMGNLHKLKHLLLSGSYGAKVVKLPLKIDQFADIQKLAGVKLTQDMAKRLRLLTQLRKLSVGEVHSGDFDELLVSAIRIKYLRSLTIKCALGERVQIRVEPPIISLEKLRIGGEVRGLEQFAWKLKSLKYLYLWDSQLPKDPFFILQNLPNLLVVSLCNAYQGERMEIQEGGFPKLRKLSIVRFSKLKEWAGIKNTVLQSLEELTISNCPNLKTIPKGLDNLSNLQVLHFINMPTMFVQMARDLYSEEKKTVLTAAGNVAKDFEDDIDSLLLPATPDIARKEQFPCVPSYPVSSCLCSDFVYIHRANSSGERKWNLSNYELI